VPSNETGHPTSPRKGRGGKGRAGKRRRRQEEVRDNGWEKMEM